MKELNHISDLHSVEVAALMTSLEYGELDPLDVPEWLADVFGGNSCTQSDYVNGYQFMHLIDLLRKQGYTIKSMYENLYSPTVEGAEEVMELNKVDQYILEKTLKELDGKTDIREMYTLFANYLQEYRRSKVSYSRVLEVVQGLLLVTTSHHPQAPKRDEVISLLKQLNGEYMELMNRICAKYPVIWHELECDYQTCSEVSKILKRYE